jgi:hypothetical protein
MKVSVVVNPATGNVWVFRSFKRAIALYSLLLQEGHYPQITHNVEVAA